ncbi:MAG: AraC family transcriptional regulator [Oceanococcus sp.]
MTRHPFLLSQKQASPQTPLNSGVRRQEKMGLALNVEIVNFPETKVALIRHRGSPDSEHETAHKLIAWKIESRFFDQAKFRSYGLHYADSLSDHRVDFCLSVEDDVGLNPYGIENGKIPSLRCAVARDVGSRFSNQAAPYLHNIWLPQSGEVKTDFPLIFHYVNVGPDVQEKNMITDVYLPLVAHGT